MQEEISFAEIKELFRELAVAQKATAAQMEADHKKREAEAEASRKKREAEAEASRKRREAEAEARRKEDEARQKEAEASRKALEAQFRETDRRIQRAFDLFESQWGKLIESLVEGDLVRLLNNRGIEVRETSQRHKGSYNGQNFEFDIIARDGDIVVIVEVKTTLRVKAIKEFVEKMQHAKEWLSEYRQNTVYGAIAFLKAEENSEVLAEKERLFVIKATGSSSSIINAPTFQPRSF